MSVASSLRRAGFTTFAAGLLIASLLFVFGPVASSTDLACPGSRQLAEYAIRGVEVWPPTVAYTDGCNDKTLQPAFVAVTCLSAIGLLVAVGGYTAGVLQRE